MDVRDYPALYVRVGRLIEQVPAVDSYFDVVEPGTMLWLGRARTLLQQCGLTMEAARFELIETGLLHSPTSFKSGFDQIVALLYYALAFCEARSPAALAGSFVPVGNSFDAFAALAKIFGLARRDVLIVDPYADETALTEFGVAVPDGVLLRLLADEATVKGTVAPAATKWASQHGSTRPLHVRLAPPKALHDRAIFVDGSQAWTLTQSLKDFAKRSPAEIVRADDTAALKIAAYEAIWAASKVVL